MQELIFCAFLFCHCMTELVTASSALKKTHNSYQYNNAFIPHVTIAIEKEKTKQQKDFYSKMKDIFNSNPDPAKQALIVRNNIIIQTL